MDIKRLIFLIPLLSVALFGVSADEGAKLFEGSKPFKNGGVACVACHNVNSPKAYCWGKTSKRFHLYMEERLWLLLLE